MSIQSSQQEAVPSTTESFRRFSLKPRKSSYGTSSKHDGSSATTDSVSVSNSSRLSFSDASRRRSSLASFSSKLRRGKKAVAEGDATSPNQGLTSGEGLCQLPAEIQISIFAYLNTTELLSLRVVSKQCLAVFQANAPAIAKNALYEQAMQNDCPPSFLIDLYPPLSSAPNSDAYLLRALRREALLRRQLDILLTFIQTRSYMLKLTRDLPTEHFHVYKAGVSKRLYYPTAIAQHYLETIRHLLLHVHPKHLSPRLPLNDCPVCTTHIQTTIASYPTPLLVPLHHTLQLLLNHFRTATRTPSSVTPFERKLRGWSYGPPPDPHMAQLVTLGCFTEFSKVNEMQGSYAKRLSIVKAFSDIVAEAVSINSDPIADFYKTGAADPVMAMAGGVADTSKRKSKTSKHKDKRISLPVHPTPSYQHTPPVPISSRKDVEDIRLGLETQADTAPFGVTRSLDVRLGLLTENVLKSIPRLDVLFMGSDTILAGRIRELRLVSDERELVTPYPFVQALMAESYEPESEADDAATQDSVDIFGPA